MRQRPGSSTHEPAPSTSPGRDPHGRVLGSAAIHALPVELVQLTTWRHDRVAALALHSSRTAPSRAGSSHAPRVAAGVASATGIHRVEDASQNVPREDGDRVTWSTRCAKSWESFAAARPTGARWTIWTPVLTHDPLRPRGPPRGRARSGLGCPSGHENDVRARITLAYDHESQEPLLRQQVRHSRSWPRSSGPRVLARADPRGKRYSGRPLP